MDRPTVSQRALTDDEVAAQMSAGAQPRVLTDDDVSAQLTGQQPAQPVELSDDDVIAQGITPQPPEMEPSERGSGWDGFASDARRLARYQVKGEAVQLPVVFFGIHHAAMPRGAITCRPRSIRSSPACRSLARSSTVSA